MAKVTKLGYKTLLSAPWYLSSLESPYRQGWKTYYSVDPQDFQGLYFGNGVFCYNPLTRIELMHAIVVAIFSLKHHPHQLILCALTHANLAFYVCLLLTWRCCLRLLFMYGGGREAQSTLASKMGSLRLQGKGKKPCWVYTQVPTERDGKHIITAILITSPVNKKDHLISKSGKMSVS